MVAGPVALLVVMVALLSACATATPKAEPSPSAPGSASPAPSPSPSVSAAASPLPTASPGPSPEPFPSPLPTGAFVIRPGVPAGTGPTVVPNVVCPESFGIDHPEVLAPVKVLRTNLPAVVAGLAAYTDAAGVQTVIAPQGWVCRAALGADGSGSIIAVPPTSSVDPEPVSYRTDRREAVSSSETSACLSCRLALVCPILADPVDANALGQTCTVTSPSTEGRTPISATTVAFEDPPGTAGYGAPSGGPDPANGVVILHPSSATLPGEGLAETCTLPASEHDLCTAILNEFVRRYG